MYRELGVQTGCGYTAEQIVNLMENIYQMHFQTGETRNDYYCGVTQRDVRDNLNRHNIERYLAAFICDNADIAAQAESLLHEAGFNTGAVANGHGGNEDSVVIYMYKITPNTRQ